MSKETWLALAARCEKAAGPDRDIERCIAAILPDGFQTYPIRGYTCSLDAITALIDAITALIERELPGWYWQTQSETYHNKAKALLRSLVGEWIAAAGDAKTPPLALCAAFCRAMAEKEIKK